MTPDEFDEFADVPEIADELGLPVGEHPVRRVGTLVEGRTVSALRWGGAESGTPELVLLHGGGQNARTWDAVVLLLRERRRRGVLAVDLPGHGRSDWRDDHAYSPQTSAVAVAAVLDRLAPDAAAVVGMSLGGLVAIRLAATRPDLVRRAVLVDVTPAAGARAARMSAAAQGTVALVRDSPTAFATFEDMLERTVAAAPPTRSRTALRRGVRHNARQDGEGRWVWRYDRNLGGGIAGLEPLWDDLSRTAMPLTLVRGGASEFVSDEDAAEVVRRRPDTAVHVVPGAGHSVQSDSPRDLARLVDDATT